MFPEALINLTNYDPEAGILQPVKFVIDIVMIVMYFLLSMRTGLLLIRAKPGSFFAYVQWLIYHLTEPLVSLVRRAFPKAESRMATLLPLLCVLTLFGADIVVNWAFRMLDARLVG